MLYELTAADIWEIDKQLWLSSPAFKRNAEKHEMLYTAARSIGEETAIQYPVEHENIPAALENLRVRGVEYFAGESGDRAYYVPDEGKIYINKYFLSEMAGYFESPGMPRVSYDDIFHALIFHEMFHHIEETLTVPTDDRLRRTYGVFAPPVYRDIAAFSFVNTLLSSPICQIIDLYWLKKHRPAQFSAIENKLRLQRAEGMSE